MRLLIIISLSLSFSALAGSKDDLYKTFIQEVKKDLAKDDQSSKIHKKPMRGPASVKPHWHPEEAPGLDKKHQQMGTSKW